MPITLESGLGQPEMEEPCLRIALVNNMGDEALKATERQFAALLTAASPGIQIHLSFYTLPGIVRSPVLTSHVGRLYGNLADLCRGSVDGLIVTGREPTTARIEQETWWPVFTDLVEWARDGVQSSIWSCLAAHAAVLCLDGIERVRYASKLTGVFPFAQTAQHALLAGLPSTLRVPHSRWNTVEEARLAASGYQVLACGEQAGVDTFIKQETSLLVFLQGHPEYRADTLSREYRRDAGRYLRGESAAYPSLPDHYFDTGTAAELGKLRARALANPYQGNDPGTAADLCRHLDACLPAHSWQGDATGLYRNWLHGLAARKYSGQERGRIHLLSAIEAVS